MEKPIARLELKADTNPNKNYYFVRDILKKMKINTVCTSAACPNTFECFGRGTATFLILGKNCTRTCSFCLIDSKEPEVLDPAEPYRVAEAVAKLGLNYAVITSVTRDDLGDGGANVFVQTIRSIRKLNPNCLVEVLTPDFGGNQKAVKEVLAARPDVFNHNIETVSRLYPEIRLGANYRHSLDLLKAAKHEGLIVKSGLIVGLGENQQEIIDAMHDIRAAGTDILTIGQYLRPTEAHHEVKRFYRIQEFSFLKQLGLSMNFKVVEAMPLVRSSYKAYESFTKASEDISKVA